MKKKKFFKRASLIALSAVMTAGIALGAAGCGGGGDDGGTGDLGQIGQAEEDTYAAGTPGDSKSKDPNTLSVWIFCNTADAQTNRDICDAWAEKYKQATGKNIKVEFSSISEKGEYFTQLSQRWLDNTVPDIFYLAPSNVRAYAEAGRLINIGYYLTTVSSDPTMPKDQIAASNIEKFNDVWANALSYYGYRRGNKMAYTMGQPIHYDANGAGGRGFYADDSAEYPVGLYGLPKDYSNFSTGYNKLFFTDAIKASVTTYKANETRTVRAPKGDGDNSFTANYGEAGKWMTYNNQTGAGRYGNVVTYAVDVNDYDNPYTEEVEHITANAGDPAPIINIGIPTAYKPFNFYRYQNFAEAYTKGDPIATLVQEYTDGKGYVVTMPGFPDETFEVPESQRDDTAPYDTSMGHIVYTYAEYSALRWAMSYYLNTFAWDGGQADPLSGTGGRKITDATGATEYEVVYAGEQYDGTDGTPLYLLPWLYSNDADVINAISTVCGDDQVAADVAITNAADWRSVASKQSNKVKKLNLDGTYREVDVQFGYNSERFIETFGAFHALGSDWNANDAGDTLDNHITNGWSYFRDGKCIFYGAGSWDSATRNESDPAMFQFGQCPAPVAENFALYSEIKDANYAMQTYSNGATAKGSGDAAGQDSKQRTNLAEGKKVYDKTEIVANQLLRQDKWGARMDSVGYAVNGQVANYTGDHAWKKEAAISLVMALTLDEQAQIDLTYGGAQLPNFISQTKDFLNYNVEGYENGAFKDMLTPEGFKDTAPEDADAVWNWYYKLVEDMAHDSRFSATNNVTVQQYLDRYDISNCPTGTIRYDNNPKYMNMKLSEFAGPEKTNRSTVMKILRMYPFNRADRDLNVRMQYGLNAVRDSAMYTYENTWLSPLETRGDTKALCYNTTAQLIEASRTTGLKGTVRTNPAESGGNYYTPAVHCFAIANQARELLLTAVGKEMSALGLV